MSSLLAISTLVVDIIAFVFHVTFQDHVTKVLNDFIVRNSSRYFNILSSLVAKGTVAVKIFF